MVIVFPGLLCACVVLLMFVCLFGCLRARLFGGRSAFVGLSVRVLVCLFS